MALLHLFQGFVDADVLGVMGAPEAEWCLHEVNGLTRDMGIVLLARAAEVGLLTPVTGSYYRIHPALPWFFQRLFGEYYSEKLIAAVRSFVAAMGEMGIHRHNQYQDGHHSVIGVLALEEANPSAGLASCSNAWWNRALGIIQGLRTLYLHSGRKAELLRLMREFVLDFVDPTMEVALPSQEGAWSLVAEYRVELALEAGQLEMAARLQNLNVDWDRRCAAPILANAAQNWNAAEKNSIRSLAVSLHQLSEILRAHGSASCLDGCREAFSLANLIQDTQAAATFAFSIGWAYQEVTEIRDLALSEEWYQRGLGLRAKEDHMGRGNSLFQLGSLAYLRFLEASAAQRPSHECVGHLSNAKRYYKQALDMFPTNAIQNLAPTHGQLGNVYRDAGQIDTALRHYGESVRYSEAVNDRLSAGRGRYSAALALARAGRFVDAREWAHSALRDYQACENGDEKVVETLKLLEEIESLRQANSPPS